MPDDTFFPELFVSWDEITPNEITAFESALNGVRNEADMQRFLEDYPRMLIQHISGGRGAWVIPQKRLGSEHVTDFLIAQKASGGFIWYAVELERPRARMFNMNGDPSSTLNHALRQIGDWRDWLSRNRDYAARPRERQGLGLIDIDPELEGLIIIGRDTNIDQSTTERRRRLMRERRVEIETYDWLLYQARDRLAALERARAAGNRSPIAEMIDALFGNPGPEKPASEAINEVFAGTFRTHPNASEEWQIELAADSEPDNKVTVAVRIIYGGGGYLYPDEWGNWIAHVDLDLGDDYNLLITESPLFEKWRPTQEQDGIWYTLEWMAGHVSQVNVIVYLPPAASNEEKIDRLVIAREVLLRYIPVPDHVPEEKP